MYKPNCNCTEKLIAEIRAKNNINENASIYFKDQNILNDSLTNEIVIEEPITTKSGKKRAKNSHIIIIHSYCPFCGKAYLAERK